MKQEIRELGHALRTRELAAADVDVLRDHAAAVRRGVRVAQALKTKESAIVHSATNRLYQKYPQQRARYQDCEVKTQRDMKLVLRYCAYSMVLDDPEYGKQRMFYWLRTIFDAFRFGSGFIGDAYRLVEASARQTMDPSDADLVCERVDEVIEILCA